MAAPPVQREYHATSDVLRKVKLSFAKRSPIQHKTCMAFITLLLLKSNSYTVRVSVINAKSRKKKI